MTPPRPRDIKKTPAAFRLTNSAIERLATILAGLEAGESFPITRLTCIKSLCKNDKALCHFALALAEMTGKRTRAKKHKPLMTLAVSATRRFVASGKSSRPEHLYAVLHRLKAVNSKYKRSQWGMIRIIQSTDVLLVEYALECILRPAESAFWGYQLARHYAEQHIPSSPHGLTSSSVPFLKDIIAFWRQYHAHTGRKREA